MDNNWVCLFPFYLYKVALKLPIFHSYKFQQYGISEITSIKDITAANEENPIDKTTIS